MVVLLYKRKGEPVWITYIKARIQKNKNFIANIFGPTGSGKTFSAISIAKMLDKEFDVDRVCNSAEEVLNLINSGKLKKGSVLVWDEAQIDLSSRNWQSQINKLINYLISTMRHRNWILLFTAPYSDFVDSSIRKLLHAQFECSDIDFTNELVKLKPRIMEYNSHYQKFYISRIVVVENKRRKKVSFWYVPKPPQDLIDDIEKKKLEFTNKLNQDIQQKIIEIRDKDKKPFRPLQALTPLQEKILECLRKDIRKQKDIAAKLGGDQAKISRNIKSLRKKGYNIDKYGNLKENA